MDPVRRRRAPRVARSITGDRARAYAYFGVAAVVIGMAEGVVWMIVDGAAMKEIADTWAAAAPADRTAAFLAANAVEEVIIGLWSVAHVVFFGLPLVLLGLAVAASPSYAGRSWLGWSGVGIGAAATVLGVVHLYTGRTTIVSHVLMPIVDSLFTIWVFATGVLLWRIASGARAKGAVAAQPAG